MLNLDFELDLSAFDAIEEMEDESTEVEAQPDVVGASALSALDYFPRWHAAKESHEREILSEDALGALMKRVYVCNIARRMYEQGLMGEEALKEGFFHLWESSERKRVAKSLTVEYINHMREVSRWLIEFKPGIPAIVETGLASVACASLGTSVAAKASRKIRDWYKVTRYNRTRAIERGDSKSFIDALAFVQALLEGYMNTRYWAVAENSRSVEERALGQRDFYNATGKPKSAYRLVMHNQRGETIVSHALKKVQPAGDVTPSPKITYKRKR